MNWHLDLLSVSLDSGAWQSLAASVLIKATIILLVSLLATWTLRRASASARHLVWSLTLTGLVFLPLLVAYLPILNLPVLPARKPATQSKLTRTRMNFADAMLPDFPDKWLSKYIASYQSLARTNNSQLFLNSPTEERDVTSIRQGSSSTMINWLVLIWGAGGLMVLLPLAAGQVRIRSMGQRSTQWNTEALSKAVGDLHVPRWRARRIKLLLNKDSISPMTWGLWRPVILLPSEARTWPADQLHAVLLHELAHIHRWDYQTQLLGRLACALYWFHPLPWIAAHRLRAESEYACDDLVLRCGSRPSDYASHLLAVARGRRLAPSLAASTIPMARASLLEGRLRAILDRSRNRRTMNRREIGLLGLMIATGLLPLSAARLAPRIAKAEVSWAQRQGERPQKQATTPVGRQRSGSKRKSGTNANVAILDRREPTSLKKRSDDQHESFVGDKTSHSAVVPLSNEQAQSVTVRSHSTQKVHGQITRADTSEPLAHTSIKIVIYYTKHVRLEYTIYTDNKGRYSIDFARGSLLKVIVHPQAGSPYLNFTSTLSSDDSAEQRTLDLKVPRGVLLTGTVVESGNGKPLKGAAVYYLDGQDDAVHGEGPINGWMAGVTTDQAGRFQIAVPPGNGQLLFYGPTADFVHDMRSRRELSTGKPGGRRAYAHAFAPYDVRQGQEQVEINAALVRGMTLSGRVVDPDGQSVQNADIITTLSVNPFNSHWDGNVPFPVRDGKFTLHGLPPDKSVKCSFLDAKNGWGTTVKLSAKLAKRPNLTIRLEPCGTAKGRLVDLQGQPVAKSTIGLKLVATPGAGRFPNEATDTRIDADEADYGRIDRLHYGRRFPISDATGEITLPYLIPGATYRIYTGSRDPGTQGYEARDFQVKTGEMLDLGDLVTRRPEDEGGVRN